ncbi:DNA invertase Pin-like site-specific DNA recombinase [Rhodoligotrophos appendicifer]|uniref:recombinase family protein n=1 Tax=Rhodoligotrophos appendicifer TaxID=987056 RepID=UPI001186CBB8|nr:recombinase family protein [Rhodoligotrophos appendicifer]
MNIGYARVSTTDQDNSIQEARLRSAGCRHVHFEKVSGGGRKNRFMLRQALDHCREGDTLMVTRVDRLARSIGDLQDILRELKEKGVELKVLDQQVDTSTPSGKCFLDMLGVFAEFETSLRRERQMEGIRKAKQKGVYKGRKPSIDIARVKLLRPQGMEASTIARTLNIGRASVYRVLEGKAS